MWHWSEGYRKATIAPLSVPFQGSLQMGAIIPLLTPPLHGQYWSCVDLVRLACSTQPTNCPWWAHYQGSQPHPAPSLGQAFRSRQHTSAHTGYPWATCTLQGRLLLAGHWCQPKLQCLLGRFLRSTGARRMVSGLVVICDFCGSISRLVIFKLWIIIFHRKYTKLSFLLGYYSKATSHIYNHSK